MNLHIKTITHKLLFLFFFTPILFANILPPNTLPFQTIQEANDAYEKGEFRKSARLFKLLKRSDATVVYNQANAEYKAGMYDDALQSYTKAKGVDEATRLYNLGNCYFKKGDFSLAISNYTNSLKLKNDDDVMNNLKLAREKRANKVKKEREEQEKKDKEKKKDKKKEDEEKKRKEEEKKKKEEEQRKKDEQKKKEDEKKNDKKKESDEKNSQSKKDADSSEKQETKKKMSPEEKMRKKELSHLVKQLSKKKMPTMMYQGKENKGERDDKNPW